MWLLLPLLSTLAAWNDTDPDLNERVDVEALIQRAERSPLGTADEPISRVERNAEGKVTRIRLDELQLSEREFRALARIPTLRSIGLSKTNVTDADIARFRALPNLANLQLNHTKITDASIPHFKSLPALRSVCLFSVNLSPEGVADLRQACRSMGIGFRRAAP